MVTQRAKKITVKELCCWYLSGDVACYRVILGDVSCQRLAVVRTDMRVFVYDVFIVHLRLVVSNVTVTSVNNEWQMTGRKRP